MPGTGIRPTGKPINPSAVLRFGFPFAPGPDPGGNFFPFQTLSGKTLAGTADAQRAVNRVKPASKVPLTHGGGDRVRQARVRNLA